MKATLTGKRTLFFFSIVIGSSSFAQHTENKMEWGLAAGVFIYQGDLSPSPLGSYKTAGPAVHLFMNRKLNPSFSLRTQLAAGKLSGNDAKFSNPSWRQQRNFRFHSPLLEVSELMIWYPLQMNQLSPYIFGGAGLTFLKITRDWSRLNKEFFSAEDPVNTGLQADFSHETPRILPVVPLGAGIRYRMNENLSLMAETSYRLSYSDYLDGFSKSAQPALKDHYFSHTVGVIYSFGKSSTLDCPVIIK